MKKNIIILIFFLHYSWSLAQTHPTVGDTLNIEFSYANDALSQNKYFANINFNSLPSVTISKIKVHFKENAASALLVEKEFIGDFISEFSDETVYRSGVTMETKVGYNELLPIHYYKIELFDQNSQLIKQYEGSVD